jgi:hypothetical protein
MSPDTVISLAIGLGGLAVAIVGTYIGYLTLKTMKADVESGSKAWDIF